MLSSYRNPINTNKRSQKISNDDSKRLQLTSKELSTKIEMVKSNTSKKNKLRCGSSKENHEIDD